jgi:hypothetical protein
MCADPAVGYVLQEIDNQKVAPPKEFGLLAALDLGPIHNTFEDCNLSSTFHGSSTYKSP